MLEIVYVCVRERESVCFSGIIISRSLCVCVCMCVLE